MVGRLEGNLNSVVLQKIIDYLVSFSKKHEEKIRKWINRITFFIGLILFLEKYTVNEDIPHILNLFLVMWETFWQWKVLIIVSIEVSLKYMIFHYLLTYNRKESIRSSVPIYGFFYTM